MKYCWPILLFSLASIFIFWPIFSHPATKLLGVENDPLLNAWILAWGSEQIAKGNFFEIFNANIYYPFHNTLALSEHLLGVSIFLWPLYVLTENPILLYNIAFVGGRLLSGLAMFWVAYHWTKNNKAALVSGFLFAFSPFFLAREICVQIQISFPFPLALGFLFIFIEGRKIRDWAIFLFLTWFQSMVCFYLFFFLILTSITIYLWALIWEAKNLLIIRLIAKQLLGLFFFGLALTPFVIPYLTVQAEWGLEGSLEFNQRGAADWADFLRASPQSWLYGSSLGAEPWPRFMPWEKSLFPGLTAMGLMLLFLTRAKRLHWKESALILLAMMGFIFSLGPQEIAGVTLPYFYLYEWFPGFKSMRVPARWMAVSVFSMSLIAALALRNIKRTSMAFILCGFIILEGAMDWNTITPGVGKDIPMVYQWLANQKDVPIVEIPLRPGYDYQYYSSFHKKRMLNGKSGYAPPPFQSLVYMFHDPNESTAIALSVAEDLGVGFALLHLSRLTRSEQARWMEALEKPPRRLIKQIDDTRIYALSKRTYSGDLIFKSIEINNQSLTLSLQNTGAAQFFSKHELALQIEIEMQQLGQSVSHQIQTAYFPSLLERDRIFRAILALDTSALNLKLPALMVVTIQNHTGKKWILSNEFLPEQLKPASNLKFKPTFHRQHQWSIQD